MQEQVEQVIEIIRPAIQADGGDINLLDVDESSGVVTVELTGACVSCPASTITMKAGVERLSGAPVRAVDIRAGAAMAIAALAADGETTIHDAGPIDRGYESFVDKLSGLGADITRQD